MKKLTLKNILIVCMSICLLIGIFFAFDVDLTTTNNIADATETYSETWNISRTGYNFTIEYSMTGSSIYSQGNGQYYLVIWQTGKGGSTNNPIFCGTHYSLTSYSKTENYVNLKHTLTGSATTNYAKMDLVFGVFIYDSNTPQYMQKYETAPPSDWPKLYDTSLSSPTTFTKGFDFTSPLATSTNDTYKDCSFNYKVNGKNVDKDEFFANANPSKEASYKTSSGTIVYDTLPKCFKALEATGGEISLLKDITLDSKIDVGKKVTQIGSYVEASTNHNFVLNLNRHKITVEDRITVGLFHLYNNLQIKNDSKEEGGIEGSYCDSLFYIPWTTNVISLKIQNGYYYGLRTIVNTVGYNYNKTNIEIEDGQYSVFYGVEGQESSIFILNTAISQTQQITNVPIAYGYSDHKNDIDVVIKGGEFSARDAIINLKSFVASYEQYNVGRKVNITGGTFKTAKYFAIADAHSKFTIGSINSAGGVFAEPSKIKFSWASQSNKSYKDLEFCKNNSTVSNPQEITFGINDSNSTFNFYNCMFENTKLSANADVTYLEWYLDLNKYKDGGFWQNYYNTYYSSTAETKYRHVLFYNFKVDYRDGNGPQIVPTQDELYIYRKNTEIDVFNPYTRVKINNNAPEQYFVCWSKGIDQVGYILNNQLYGDLVSKESKYDSSQEYGYLDFFEEVSNNLKPVGTVRYYYAVWSLTNIYDYDDEFYQGLNLEARQAVKYHQNYSNIVPIITQTITWIDGTGNLKSYNGKGMHMTVGADAIVELNKNIVIDVRDSSSAIAGNAIYGMYFRTKSNNKVKFNINSGLSLRIFASNLNGNENAYGVYTVKDTTLIFTDAQLEDREPSLVTPNVEINVNNVGSNITGESYGIYALGPFYTRLINLTLNSISNYSFTGIAAAKDAFTEDTTRAFPYIEGSTLKINCTVTDSLKKIVYIDAATFGITALNKSNIDYNSTIICNIINPSKFNISPYFNFSGITNSASSQESCLYSEGILPYVDNISTKLDVLNISAKQFTTTYKNDSSSKNLKYGLTGEDRGYFAKVLYHYDTTRPVIFSNVYKFINNLGTKKYASLKNILISTDGTSDYSMTDDYSVEDSIYTYGTNHSFSLCLNGKFLYVNNTINVGPNTATLYGTGRIYSGVGDYNYMFTSTSSGTVRIVNQPSGTKTSYGVDISIYAGDSYLCDSNVNVYIGHESITSSSTRGNGIIDIKAEQLTTTLHIMSGWMKYDIVADTSYYEDGTKVIKVKESDCVDGNYQYLVVNNDFFVWNGKKYSSLSKAYAALANAYSTNPKCVNEISVTDSVYLMKNFVADTCDVKIDLSDKSLNMFDYSISTKSNHTITIVGNDVNSFATIQGNGEMFSGNIELENCRVTSTNKIQYMFVGNSSNIVILKNCGITADNFSSYSLRVLMYGGYFNIHINSQMNNIYIYNGYFINNISSYVQHLDGVLIYTTGINVTDPWLDSIKYSCQFFSHDTVEVTYSNKKINYLSLSAAIKAVNEDNSAGSYTLTLLDDAYMFSNYLTNNTIDVIKNITIVGKDPSKMYTIFLQNNYLTIKSSISISNAIILGNKFFYLNDSLGNVDLTLKNCKVIQNDTALDSDCIINYSKVAESTMIVKVIFQNNNYIESNKGLFYLGSDVDYKFLGDGNVYFNVNDLGRQMKVSELTGLKKIYYAYDVSKDIVLYVDNDYVSIGELTGDYISIGATNIDYKNGLDTKYVYKTISNPQSINVASNYDINWYDETNDNFIIKNKKQLLGLAAICNGYVTGVENVTFAGKTIRLGADIDLSGINWQPIFAFDGTFYGDNYKITNLCIDCMTSNNYYYGLFATFTGPLIRDLEVTGTMNISTYIDTYPMLLVGGLVGYIQSQVINCASNIEMIFDCPKLYDSEDIGILVGGMFGYAATSGIYNCVYKSTITTTLPAEYNHDLVYIGTIAGAFSSSQIVNTYVEKESDYCFTDESIESSIYNSYYITKSSNKFSVYEKNQINVYSDYKIVSKLLDDAAFAFDKSILLDKSVELYYWDVEDGIPVFYNGPYFKLSINEKILKTCDEGFSYEPLKEGYTFEKWLRVNNDYTSAVDKNPSTLEYDASCFNSRTYYYAYYKANNEITEIRITGWTYGETANKPFAKSKFGNVKYNYAVKGTTDFSTTVPSNAGLYTLKAFVQDAIEYRGAELTLDFEIKKATYDMSGITFTDKSYEYDTKEKTITIIGFLPNGVSVSYTSNAPTINKLTNVGKIEVTANFASDNATNYNDIPSMKAMLEIYKATINMDSLRFVDTYYTYNPAATEYVINEIGTWPVGIQAIKFENHRLTNADLDPTTHCGSTLATAKFTYDTANYNEVSDMQATLYVNTYKSFDIRFVQFVGQTYVYSKGTKRSLEIDLDGKELPNGVTVSYLNNNQENAGEYAVVAHFTAGNEIVENGKVVGYMISGERYNPINDIVAKLVINKAKHDVTSAKNDFKNASYTYDPNTTWSLSINSQFIPQGVTVKYLNNALKEVGSVNVVAQFIVDENNYEHIDDCYATLTVTKATYDIDKKVFFNNAEYVYDGTLKTIKIDPSSKLPDGVTVKYSIIEKQYRQDSDISDEAGAITVGSISVYAIFTGDSKNYEPIDDKVATITITKAQYDIESTVFFKNVSYIYDGKIHSIYLTDKDGKPATLPKGLNVYYSTNTLGKAGSITVTATFDGDFINYKDLNDPDKWKAVLTIEKATYNMSAISFNDAEYEFDNSSKVVEISGALPKGVTVSYKNNKGLQVGTYKAIAIFKVDERNYNKIPQMEATLTIKKATYDMSKIKFEDTIFVYNGEYQTIEIVGTLPNGVTVSYQHNSLKDVCETLDAIASFKILDKINYNEIPEMRAKFTIIKADYDMSGIKFESADYIYDGLEKKIEIVGILPNGVTVRYETNSTINAATLTAKAIFSGDYNNYNVIPDMTATLLVNKATYNMSYIKFENVSYQYDGNEKKLEITQQLPDGVTVEYSNNVIKNSGSLLVIATFSVLDEVNYNAIPQMTATITIEKLTYDMSSIKFENATYVYDGKEKKLQISGSLPYGVQESYSENRMVDVGVLEVTVAFRGDTANHNTIPQMTATLTITKANYDLSTVAFNDVSVLYDGQVHMIEITGALPKGVSVMYENNSKTEPGVYTVIATVSGDTYNYYSKEYTAILTIQNTQLKNDESESKSLAVVYADSGFTKDVSLKSGYSTEIDKYTNLKTRDTKILGYYSVSLFIEDETGNIVEYQPNECTVSGSVKVKLLLSGIDLREVEKIYHVHKDGSIEEIAFNMDMFDGLYITLELTSLSDFVFVAHDNTYKMTMIMNYCVLGAIILVGLYLINTIFYIVWKKKGIAILKFMVPLYRFKNKLFFKIKFNDKEILDQTSNAGEKPDKKDNKDNKKPKDKNKKKNKKK